MARVLQKEIGTLKKHILELSAMVEEALHDAVGAFNERDEQLASKVIERDAEIDRTEIEVEEEGLKILALHQPVAVDLRFIVSVLKINSDLERIGDLAVNTAQRAIALCQSGPVDIPFDLVDMAARVKTMLKRSLDALVNFDAALAREVVGSDDDVDALNHDILDFARSEVLRGTEHAGLIEFVSTARDLERIGDHAANIAKDVIYMLEGDIVRHSKRLHRDNGRKDG